MKTCDAFICPDALILKHIACVKAVHVTLSHGLTVCQNPRKHLRTALRVMGDYLEMCVNCAIARPSRKPGRGGRLGRK